MKYITITHDKTLQRVISEIEYETGVSRTFYVVTESPIALMGNQKVLVIRHRNGLNVICKVDGTGFRVDELYLELL